MAKFMQIMFYVILANCLILGEFLWSNGAENIAQCQRRIEEYQSKHQSAVSFHSRQARVKHLLKILKSKPLDIAERVYLHYLSINDPNSELLASLADCLVKFLALNEKKDIKNLDLSKRIILHPLEKLRALDQRETGLFSRFGVEEKDFDDAVGLGIEVVKPRRPSQAVKAPMKTSIQAPIDIELTKQELRSFCEIVRNINHDQHFDEDKRLHTLDIVANFESLVRKLRVSNNIFDKLHDLTNYYKERKDSLSFDLVKRAVRDICQEISGSALAKTPGELLAELAKLADNYKKQMIAKAREAFEDLQNTEELKTALRLKQKFDAAEEKLKNIINLTDLVSLKVADQAVQEFSPVFWALGKSEFLNKLTDFKQLLPKVTMTVLDRAIKDFSLTSNEENAEKVKQEAKKIFLRVEDLDNKYLDAQNSFDSKNQQLIKKYIDAEFLKDYANHKYDLLAKRIIFARPGTVKDARAIGDEFAEKVAKDDVDIRQKIDAIFKGQ